MKRLTAALTAACLWLCLGLTGCGDDGTGKGFRFPLEGEPVGLDPQMATDTASVTVLCALFEGLTRLDADGTVSPGAATFAVSEDQKTYTFTLKESYWSTLSADEDGAPFSTPLRVTADDFLFAWQRAVDPATGSPVAAEFDAIRGARAVRTGQKKLDALGVSAPDEQTLVVTLAQPDAGFLARLATTPFMPCHRAFFEHTGGRYGLERDYVLSNGAFWLAAWNHGESLLMYKNEHHHAAAEVAPEAVRYIIGTEDPVAAIRSGDLDAAPLTGAERDTLGTAATYVTLQDTVRGLWFHTGATPFSNADVRRALRDSIDWGALRTFLTEKAPAETPATGFLPPDALVTAGESYHTAAGGGITPTTDRAAAKAALQKGLAAIAPDAGRLRFELLAADDALSADLARYLVQSWQKHLGVYPTLTLLPEKELIRRVESGAYQAALYTHSPTGLTGAENLACFGSDAADTLARLNSPAMTAALDKAADVTLQSLAALDKTLWQMCPCVPLSYPARYYGLRAGVTGVTVAPFGGGRYHAALTFLTAKKPE